MQKLAMVLLVLLLVISGAGYYLYSNLDSLVERAIESAGTSAVGAVVTVDSVSIDLGGGRASIRGFSVANPSGYSNGAMLAFGELTVILDTSRLSTTQVGIVSITALSPRVLYETRDEISNFDMVMQRFGSAPATTAPAQPEQARAVQVAIGTFSVSDIVAALQSPLLPQPVQVNLGDIALQNLEGTPAELGQQILRPLLSQLSRNAGAAMLGATAAQLRDTAAAVGQQALQEAGRQLDNAGEAIGETGGRLREGIGNLLDRDQGAR